MLPKIDKKRLSMITRLRGRLLNFGDYTVPFGR